jgi:hypothetical protein
MISVAAFAASLLITFPHRLTPVATRFCRIRGSGMSFGILPVVKKIDLFFCVNRLYKRFKISFVRAK